MHRLAVFQVGAGEDTDRDQCQNIPAFYDPRICCTMPTSIRFVCAILWVLSGVEILLESCIFVIAFSAVKPKSGNILKLTSGFGATLGLFRIGTVYYLYSTIKETLAQDKIAKVITARALCIWCSPIHLIMVFLVGITLQSIAISTDVYLLQLIHSSEFYYVVVVVVTFDVLFLVCYAYCVVETYRTSVIEASLPPEIEPSGDWVHRDYGL